ALPLDIQRRVIRNRFRQRLESVRDPLLPARLEGVHGRLDAADDGAQVQRRNLAVADVHDDLRWRGCSRRNSLAVLAPAPHAVCSLTILRSKGLGSLYCDLPPGGSPTDKPSGIL